MINDLGLYGDQDMYNLQSLTMGELVAAHDALLKKLEKRSG